MSKNEKLQKYEFGVMSSKYKLEAKSEEAAHSAMAVFIGKNVPIAVYKLKEYAISPLKILQKPCMDAEALKAALKTIKAVKL